MPQILAVIIVDQMTFRFVSTQVIALLVNVLPVPHTIRIPAVLSMFPPMNEFP